MARGDETVAAAKQSLGYKPSEPKQELDRKLSDPIVIERREVIDTITPGGDGMPMIPSAFLSMGEYINNQPPHTREGMRLEFSYQGVRFAVEVESAS